MPSTIALIVAAGRGRRLEGAVPKQYRALGGQPILRRTATAFLGHSAITAVQVVIHPDDRALYDEAAAGLPLPEPILGGATRQESVCLGLEGLAARSPDCVLIHDGVRPFVDAPTIAAVIRALDDVPAAIAGVPVIDTLKRVNDGLVTATIDRNSLWRAQTPQGFRFSLILGAHRRFQLDDPRGVTLTDDSIIAERAGLAVRMVKGSEDNLKITTDADLERAARILAAAGSESRLGFGSAIGEFGPGDHVMLCGIGVPHDNGLARQPDRDVALDALADALLGAVSESGGASGRPLADAVSSIAARGGRVVNVDVTIVCERPKIGPHRERMVQRLAALLNCTPDRVSVKATTTEGLGFTGRREGLLAQAITTIELPLQP